MIKKDEIEVVRQVGIFDAHCHPTDIMDSIARIPRMRAKVLTVMSTRSQDQELVADVAERYLLEGRDQLDRSGDERYVIPAFGWHPWFSHQMYFDTDTDDHEAESVHTDAIEHYKSVLVPMPEDTDFLNTLMRPISFSKYLKETEERLRRFPLALVGEIGLDRGFRLPAGPTAQAGDESRKAGGDKGTYTAGSREGRRLSPYKVNMNHQKRILRGQLDLAAKLKRPVSVHSVQAHGVVLEILQDLWKGHMRPSKRELRKKRDAEGIVGGDGNQHVDMEEKILPYPPRICMHSYSGPRDALRIFLDPKAPAEVFFSFSECINFGNPVSDKATEVIQAVPEDRILIESDLHCAGEVMDGLLEDIVIRICEIKGWQLADGANILKRNWQRFIFGD